jgi:hypothetical protein
MVVSEEMRIYVTRFLYDTRKYVLVVTRLLPAAVGGCILSYTRLYQTSQTEAMNTGLCLDKRC